MFTNKLDEVEEKIEELLAQIGGDKAQLEGNQEIKRLEQSKKFFKKHLDTVKNENNVLDNSKIHGKFLTRIY